MIAADEFYAILVKLAVTSGLGTVITEHRANIEQLGTAVQHIEVIFHKAAHHGSGSLRTQGKFTAFTVGKAIHFLFHNVGAFAGAAFKKVCRFKYGCADFGIAKAGGNAAKAGLKILPFIAIGRKDVECSTGNTVLHLSPQLGSVDSICASLVGW